MSFSLQPRNRPGADHADRSRKPRLTGFRGFATEGLESEADSAAEAAVRGRSPVLTAFPATSLAAGAGVQRKCGCAPSEQCACNRETPGVQRQSLSGALAQVGSTASGLVDTALGFAGLGAAVIVEDGVDLEPDQIMRSAFLARLRSTVCEAANAELAEVGRSTEGCPYIQQWLANLHGRTAREIDRMVSLYARPSQRNADGYLEAIASRTRDSVRTWKRTGSVDAVPGVAAEVAAGAMPQRKADGGPAPQNTSASAIQARLGPGRPLEGGVRHRMESSFGAPFGSVRVHTDQTAAHIAAEQGALALTVGNHVVMGRGLYRPGTTAGDLLLAHELAHTIQQRGGSSAVAGESHERDADHAAAGAVLSGRGARPRLGVGLGVQGCKPTRKQCPPGMMWGTVANATSAGAGSFGCTCVYRCVAAPSSQPNYPQICPAHGCSPVQVVGEDYVFRREGRVERAPVSERAGLDERAIGWGGAATPLTAPAACLCPGVDIEGEDRSEGAHMEEVGMDLTDLHPGPRDTTTGVPVPNRPRVEHAPRRTSAHEGPPPRPHVAGGAPDHPGPGRPFDDPARPHVQQREGNWCGAACGEMAARDLGVHIRQDQLAATPHFEPRYEVGGQVVREGGFHTAELARALTDVAPVRERRWLGGTMHQDISTANDLRTHLSGYLQATGTSVILRVRGGSHWIVVDQVRSDGIAIRDPGRQRSTLVTPDELHAMRPTGELVLSFPQERR